MRAPPPPRRSRSRIVALYFMRVRQLLTGYKLKKRWHLHKLHRLQRKGKIITSPISGVRVEDMINIPTGLQPNASKRKPLLIATFPKGCARSPRVRLLQKNRLSKLMISRRRYKLKYFETEGLGNIKEKQNVTHQCAYIMGSIKKGTSRNADVKAIFHESNVIKCSNLEQSSKNCSRSPELLEFGPQQSIRMKDYASLRKKNWSLRELDNENNNRNAKTGILGERLENKTDMNLAHMTNTSVKQAEAELVLPSKLGDTPQNIMKAIRVVKFADSPVLSYSRPIRVSANLRNSSKQSRFRSPLRNPDNS